jgi:hypothetical protein
MSVKKPQDPLVVFGDSYPVRGACFGTPPLTEKVAQSAGEVATKN